MFGFHAGVNEYARVGVETGVVAANPSRLIVMMYEGAIASCNLAIKHIIAQDFAAKSAALSKAIMIIESGLRLSLDKKAGGEIAESLDSLYAYMSNRLYMANLKSNLAPVEEVVKLLNELNEAWVSLANNQVAAPTVRNSVPQYTTNLAKV
ncbi:flagellar export chaperone FliS [Methylobacillus gramineus]|uniref:flagellar export chaperone FliS n=1 Tax=Methylobacillus gramineus TaxID=755169 RepID=UPI001CFFC674|nr:flagellar export chaperone FliS [Methylobacillus gramineus]MCB5183757.1 flagellar export chaperone FliS [Methylobacillus gramineus]